MDNFGIAACMYGVGVWDLRCQIQGLAQLDKKGKDDAGGIGPPRIRYSITA